VPDSFGCRRCYGEDPRAAWAYYEEGLAVERELVGDSHFLVQLRRCADCGQQFVWIFGEAVDWKGGDDAQRREIVPVSATEAEAAGRLDYPSRSGRPMRQTPRSSGRRASFGSHGVGFARAIPDRRTQRADPATESVRLGKLLASRARRARWWVAGSGPESKSAGPVR